MAGIKGKNWKRLTKRHVQWIIMLNREGRSTKEIADVLGIPEAMVVRVVNPNY